MKNKYYLPVSLQGKFMGSFTRVVCIFIFLVFIKPTASIYAQESTAQSTTAHETENRLKKAANKYFEQGDFIEAYPLYSQLLSLYPRDPNYNYRFGACMLFTKADKNKAVEYLTFSVKQPSVDDLAYYYLGRALHLNYRFNEAIRTYRRFEQIASSSELKKYPVRHYIEMCSNAKQLLSTLHGLDVLRKKELNLSDYFEAYDMHANGGTLLAEPDGFKTKTDKEKNVSNVIYLTPDKKHAYFSSYGNNDKNGKDIYVVSRNPDGTWGTPENLGTIINTAFDEDYPVYDVPRHTLYFCSKGHNSMGGYDIFSSVYNASDKTWSEPVNMDFPINTPDDDILFVPDTSGQTAFFSSTRSSPQGTIDVYKIALHLHPPESVVIAGNAFSDDGKTPALCKITVKDIKTNNVVGVYMSSSDDGKYSFDLPNGGSYNFTIEASNHKTQSQSVVLPVSDNVSTMQQDIKFDPSGNLQIKSYVLEMPKDSDYQLALNYMRDQANLNVNVDTNTIKSQLAQSAANATNSPAVAANSGGTNPSQNGGNGASNAVSPGNGNNNSVPGNGGGNGNSNSTQANNSSETVIQLQQEEEVLNDKAAKAIDYGGDKMEEAQQLQARAEDILNNPGSDGAGNPDSVAAAKNLEYQSKGSEDKGIAAYQLAADYKSEAAAKQIEIDKINNQASSKDSANSSKSLTQSNNQSSGNNNNEVSTTRMSPGDLIRRQAEQVKEDSFQVARTNDDLVQVVNVLDQKSNDFISEAGQTDNSQQKVALLQQAEDLKKSKEEKEQEINENKTEMQQMHKENAWLNSKAQKADSAYQASVNNGGGNPSAINRASQPALEKEIDDYVAAHKTNYDSVSTENMVADNYPDEGMANNKNNSTGKTSANYSSHTKHSRYKKNTKHPKKSENITANSGQNENNANGNNNSGSNPEVVATNNNNSTTTQQGNNSLPGNSNNQNVAANSGNSGNAQPGNTTSSANNVAANNGNSNSSNNAGNNGSNNNQGGNQGSQSANNIASTSGNNNSGGNQNLQTANSNNNGSLTSGNNNTGGNNPVNNNAGGNQNLQTANNNNGSSASSNNPVNNNAGGNQNLQTVNSNNNGSSTGGNNSTAGNNIQTTNNSSNNNFSQPTNNSTANSTGNNGSQNVSQPNADTTAGNKNIQVATNDINAAPAKNGDVKTNAVKTQSNNNKQVKKNSTINNNNGSSTTNGSSSNKTVVVNSSEGNSGNNPAPVTNNGGSGDVKSSVSQGSNAGNNVPSTQNNPQSNNGIVASNTKSNPGDTGKANSSNDSTLAVTPANSVPSTFGYKKSTLPHDELLDSLANAVPKPKNSDKNNSKKSKNQEAFSVTTVQYTDTAAASLNQKSQNYFTAANSLVDLAEKTRSKAQNEKDKSKSEVLYNKADSLDDLIFQLNLKGDETLAEANYHQYYTNLNQMASIDVKPSKSQVYKVTVAKRMMKDADNSYRRSLSERDRANSTRVLANKHTYIKSARQDLANAILKQQSAVYLYFQVDSDQVANTMGQSTSDSSLHFTYSKFISAKRNKTKQPTTSFMSASSPNTTNNTPENVTTNTPATSTKVKKTVKENPVSSDTTSGSKPPVATNNRKVKGKNNKNKGSAENATVASTNSTEATNNKVSTSTNNSSSGSIEPVTISATDNVFEEVRKSPYSASNPIPIDPPLPMGLVFKVQVGAFKNAIPQNLFQGFQPIIGLTAPEGYIRYSAGLFRAFDVAKDALGKIRGLGYPDAFLIAFFDGKRITIAEALAKLGISAPPVVTTGQPGENNGSGNGTTSSTTGGNSSGSQGNGTTVKAETGSENNDQPTNRKGRHRRKKKNESNTSGSGENGQQSNNVTSSGGNKVVIVGEKTITPSKKTLIDERRRTQKNIKDTVPPSAKPIKDLKGLVFTVQVGSFPKHKDFTRLKKIKQLYTSVDENGTIKYSCGPFASMEEAKAAKDIILANSSAKDAFITAYDNGKRISLTKAAELLKKGNEGGNPESTSATTSTVNPAQSNNSTTATEAGNASNSTEGNTTDEKNNNAEEDNGSFEEASKEKVVYTVQIASFTGELPIDIANKILMYADEGIEPHSEKHGVTSYYAGKYTDYESANTLQQKLYNEGFKQAVIIAYYHGKKISLQEAQTINNK